jgi:protein pelota
MRILHEDLRKGQIKLQIDNLDDLWYISQVIESGDVVKAKTFRKIKLGDGADKNAKIIKKEVFLSINVEKTEFHKFSDIFRISGKVIEGIEEIPSGSYHTINVEVGTVFELTKPKFFKFQIDKIHEAAKEDNSKILILVHDREEGIFSLLKRQGYEILLKMTGNVAKKAEGISTITDFYSELYKKIQELDARYSFDSIVVASPTFWKEYLMKKIADDSIRKKVVLSTCSSVSENGISEVIKRPEIQSALKQERSAREAKLVDDVLEQISKQGKVEYGFVQVSKAVDAGAVESMLISDALIQKKRQNSDFDVLDQMMKKVDSLGGEIHLLSSEHDGGKKLDGLGGIAALLRYKIYL